MKHLFLALSILVLLLFPFQPLKVQAQTTNLQDYKEYDSFQKKYYQHLTDLTYLVSVSYESNQHYFKENMDIYRNAAMQVFNANEGGFIDGFFDSSEELFTKPVSFLATANDLRRELFSKIKSLFGKEEAVQYSEQVLDGYYYKVGDDVRQYIKAAIYSFSGYYGSTIQFRFLTSTDIYINVDFNESNVPIEEFRELWTKHNSTGTTLFDFFPYFGKNGVPTLKILPLDGVSPELPITQIVYPPFGDVFENIINGYRGGDNQSLKDYTPTVSPVLICPSDKIQLSFENGIFKTADDVVIALSEEETASYNGGLCNLDFEFPEIYHHETGKLIIGGEDFSPTLPEQNYDYSIVEYVRNSYDYATSVVNSGVNGLKSIVAGTVGLVTFSGSLFGFLPPELLTLFIGGFSVALGLWVFKK